MRHASLFSGIGGFDLAAHWMGWENVFQVERDPFCLRVLQHHFPDTDRFGDIHEFTGPTTAQYANRVDVLSGGFPCQPYSTAGKRRGKADDRHLWSEMLRTIREIRPRWIVGENVRGFANWSNGMVLEEVLADMEAEGYRTAPPFIIPACGQNAPHRRDRVWLIAHADGAERSPNVRRGDGGQAEEVRRLSEGVVPAQPAGDGQVAVAQRDRARSAAYYHAPTDHGNFPTVPPVRVGYDGLPPGLVRYPDRATDEVREEGIRAAGNAIDPHIALAIFQAIAHVEENAAGA